MNSRCHGFNIDVTFKIQMFVHFFLNCSYYFYLSFIFRLYFFYILYVYFFVPSYIPAYVCKPGECKFFCLICRCWYRKKIGLLCWWSFCFLVSLSPNFIIVLSIFMYSFKIFILFLIYIFPSFLFKLESLVNL